MCSLALFFIYFLKKKFEQCKKVKQTPIFSVLTIFNYVMKFQYAILDMI